MADAEVVRVVDEDSDEGDDGYSLHHVAAVVRPVCITMILSCVAVAWIRDPSDSSFSPYLVYNSGGGGGGGGVSSGGGGSGNSTGQDVGEAAVNALVIVSVVAGATFLFVILYRLRCARFLQGYLMLASFSLLGYSGALMAVTAAQVFHVPVDWVTLAFVMWNFAAVGVASIFFSLGIPRGVTQGYLVCSATIMTWILSKVPEWTSWTLLVALAFYDLCAVLTPCGPLKALVNASNELRDPIPGLLYEASLGSGGKAAPPPSLASSPTPVDVSPRISSSLLPQRRSRPPPHPRGAAEVVESPVFIATLAASTAEGAAAASVSRTSINNSGSPGGRPESEPSVDGSSVGGDDDDDGRAIKLGLGDFVFYSVLVSRAALFDASTFAACFVAVLLGLTGTLALLTLYRKALPALPISIFLGVLIYAVTRFAVGPPLEAAVVGVGA